MITKSQGNFPAYYEVENDRWIFNVPHGVSQAALSNVARFVYKIQKDRWLAATGDTKLEVGRSLRALEAGRYIGMLSGKGDHEFFKSTEGTGKVFSFGGFENGI